MKKIFLLLFFLQGPTLYAGQQVINPFEDHTIEEIALLFNNATFKASAEYEDYLKKILFDLPESEDLNKFYKARNILIPGFYFLDKFILKPITNKWYEHNFCKNIYQHPQRIGQINNNIALYATTNCAMCNNQECKDIHHTGHKRFFLKNNSNNKGIPIQIYNKYFESRFFAKTGLKEYDECKLKNKNELHFRINPALTNSYYGCTITLSTDTNILTELKRKEEQTMLRNNGEFILFLLFLLFAYRSPTISIKSLFFLPKLLHELYHHQNWEEFFSQNSDVYNDKIFFWSEVINMSFNICYKPDVDKYRTQKEERKAISIIFDLYRLARETNDPELLQKAKEYNTKFFKEKYE